MLKFQNITLKNLSKLEKELVKSERAFPKDIRGEDGDYFTEMLETKGVIAKIAKLDSKYIGNIIGCPVTEEDVELYELHGLSDISKTIHLCTMVIDPPHRKNGYGRQLLLEFIKAARKAGYETLAGHFRRNASQHIIKALGGKKISTHKNWSDTGESYVLYELELRQTS